MQSNLILTTAQAQAVYSAMCALNQVGGGQVEAYVDAAFALVREHLSGCVRVVSIRENDKREEYADQAAFAAAYGLRDAPDAADLLAALQTAHMALTGYLPAHRNALTDAAIETCRATIARNSA